MAWFGRPQPNPGTEGDVVARRIGAILIDLILTGALTSIVGASLGPGGITGVIGLLITFGYYIYFEGTYGHTVGYRRVTYFDTPGWGKSSRRYRRQYQTLGKMALGLVVVTEGGGAVDYGAAAIRTLLRLVDVLPVFYLVGFVAMLLTDRPQRIGDIAADTVVVRAARPDSDNVQPKVALPRMDGYGRRCD